MRRAAKVDVTHATIRDGLRDIGWSVFDASGVAGGFPDLLVGVGQPGEPDGANVLLEVKRSKRGRLTPAQERFFADWRGPRFVVTTLEEAVMAVRSVAGVRMEVAGIG